MRKGGWREGGGGGRREGEEGGGREGWGGTEGRVIKGQEVSPPPHPPLHLPFHQTAPPSRTSVSAHQPLQPTHWERGPTPRITNAEAVHGRK